MLKIVILGDEKQTKMKLKRLDLTEDFSEYHNINSDDSKSLDELSKVNILIGANNSGKSRFLRSLFSKKFSGNLSTSFLEDLQKKTQDASEIINKYNITKIVGISTRDIKNAKYGFPVIKDKILTLDVNTAGNYQLNLRSPAMADFYEGSNIISQRFENVVTPEDRLLLESSLNTFHQKLGEIKSTLQKQAIIFNYIPILRGMRPFSESSSENYYHSRTLKDYFSNLDKNEIIYTGYDTYKKIEELLLGSSKERELIRDYEQFLSDTIFLQKVTLIPKRGKDVLLITIGDEEERLLYDLGDGIQSIILLTFSIFLNKDNYSFFYIEEPEINLHPGLQTRFIKILTEKFEKHQYFISTHSNHFLESVFDSDKVSLFSFKKNFIENRFDIESLKSPNTNILNNLGVRNTSLFMSNCTIWIEGITDRLYLKKYLEVYFKYRATQNKEGDGFESYKEDQHYSFVEYSGSNIVHWTFEDDGDSNTINAKRVANRVLLIADADYDSKGKIPISKLNRFKQLKKSLGSNFIQLQSKEIENTLTENIVMKVVAKYENKSESEISIKKKTRFSFNKKNLGEWIDKKIQGTSRKYAKGNTINNKLDFCHKAINEINSYDDLSKEAKNLCLKIYRFIEENNKEYI